MLLRLGRIENIPSELLAQVETVRNLLQNAEHENENKHEHTAMVSQHTGGCGRPFLIIPFETLDRLLEMEFSVPSIACMLGVSVRTVRNRMTEYGLSVRDYYSVLTDHELDEQVLNIVHSFPNTGYKQMLGHLKSQGLRISIMRVRESMRRVDPTGVLDRSLRLHVIHKRKYTVLCPGALWHIDGHHKLIR